MTWLINERNIDMISVTQAQIDLTKLELGDIIDVNTLQNFLDNFAVGFNCAAVSVGRRGEEFTKPSHYRPFCSTYIHTSQIGDERCAKCHNDFGRRAISQNRPYIGQCHAGLVDFAAPVIIRGEHIGTVLGGQILDKPADEPVIRKVAYEINVDSDGLWDAAQNIDLVPKQTIAAAAQVLYIVVNALAQGGFNRIETDFLSSQLAGNFIQISDNVGVLADDSQSIARNQRELVTEISQIRNNIDEVTKVLRLITRIADQTKILGINAAIEAARIGTAGKSFAVVAEEIRKLSETTKQTVEEVDKINECVENSIHTTMESANKTLETTSGQSASMDLLSTTVKDSVSLAEKLRSLFDSH
jgi:ligand-binding sensor protein